MALDRLGDGPFRALRFDVVAGTEGPAACSGQYPDSGLTIGKEVTNDIEKIAMQVRREYVHRRVVDRYRRDTIGLGVTQRHSTYPGVALPDPQSHSPCKTAK